MDRSSHDTALELELPSSAAADIPEEPDTMNTTTDEAPAASERPFPPPAHLAARFYRPPTTTGVGGGGVGGGNRRKSSAASSRRTSISSSHSHQSGPRAASLRSGCQSNHVAQQLRRTSILESRKARLADRAAHAEQVRLRAALAKAAPPARASASEERALAAAVARERHLAQVAAACAEEVRRAKKVAEDMKERKAADERRYRLEMEEKHAEAERRRLEYMRNLQRAARPRTASVPPPPTTASAESKLPVVVEAREVNPMGEETAVRRIQAAWRTRRRRKVVEGFTALGLSIDRVQDTSFDEISALLSEERVVSTALRLLGLFGLFAEGEDGTAHQTATRTFLSAYLILGHPTSILSRDGDQEQDLINKAKDLMISFESTLFKLSASNRFTPTPSLLETISLAHATYVAAFADWKARDASALIETMVGSFVNLDAIWQTVKDDTEGGVADDYRQGIRDNQVILLAKIRKLAGPDRANTLIKRAIRESRRSRPKRRPLGDVRPRVADAAAESGSSDAVVHAGRDVSVDSNITDSDDAPAADETHAGALTKLFSVVPPNRVLVHELALDREFRIDAGPQSELRSALHREICDRMRDGFERGEGGAWTVAMAENIRGKLLRLLTPGNSMHALIADTLDPDLIRTQCAQGAFSYGRFFAFMASVLPKLCAPYRDAHVTSLGAALQATAADGAGDLAGTLDTLFRLLHTIDLLSLDYSNFLLLSAAPTLIREAPAYERREFAADLAAGRITLARTRRWWRDAAVRALTEPDDHPPRPDPSPRGAGASATPQLYARALVDLALRPTGRPLAPDDVPETLALDAARLARVREHGLRVATVAAVLLTAKNLLKRDARAPWKAAAARMWDLLGREGYGPGSSPPSPSTVATTTTATAEAAVTAPPTPAPDLPARLLAAIESSHALPPPTRAALLATTARLLAAAAAHRVADPVPALLHRRLRAHVLGRLAATSSGERVRAASAASAGLAAAGLAEFAGSVAEMVAVLGRVGEVDVLAHGEWLREVAGEVEGEGTGA